MDFPERGEGRFSLVNKLELEVGDVVAYKEFFHMTKEQFSFLLGKVSPLIQKKEQPPPINAVRETIARWTPSCNATVFGNGRNISFSSSTRLEFHAKQFLQSRQKQPVLSVSSPPGSFFF